MNSKAGGQGGGRSSGNGLLIFVGCSILTVVGLAGFTYYTRGVSDTPWENTTKLPDADPKLVRCKNGGVTLPGNTTTYNVESMQFNNPSSGLLSGKKWKPWDELEGMRWYDSWNQLSACNFKCGGPHGNCVDFDPSQMSEAQSQICASFLDGLEYRLRYSDNDGNKGTRYWKPGREDFSRGSITPPAWDPALAELQKIRWQNTEQSPSCDPRWEQNDGEVTLKNFIEHKLIIHEMEFSNSQQSTGWKAWNQLEGIPKGCNFRPVSQEHPDGRVVGSFSNMKILESDKAEDEALPETCFQFLYSLDYRLRYSDQNGSKGTRYWRFDRPDQIIQSGNFRSMGDVYGGPTPPEWDKE